MERQCVMPDSSLFAALSARGQSLRVVTVTRCGSCANFVVIPVGWPDGNGACGTPAPKDGAGGPHAPARALREVAGDAGEERGAIASTGPESPPQNSRKSPEFAPEPEKPGADDRVNRLCSSPRWPPEVTGSTHTRFVRNGELNLWPERRRRAVTVRVLAQSPHLGGARSPRRALVMEVCPAGRTDLRQADYARLGITR